MSQTDALITGLDPSGEYILFTFLDGLWNGTVSDKTEWGFEYQVSTANTAQPARWGLVHAVGEDVTNVKPGQYVFIEPLMWTEFQTYGDRKIWWTGESKVLGVTDDRPTE